ncbi:MAG: TonB-dependent receptor [Mediterranea sp.]|nr:TonB-dependent receptor [Mediterranea sp.]
MNRDYKKREPIQYWFLTTLAIIALFFGSNSVMANQTVSDSSHDVKEQMQSQAVSGVVVDNKGESIIGASVLEKGTANGTITDIDGRFSLDVKQGATLIISYIGYKAQEVEATKIMRIILQEDSEILDEVVVVGYGTQKKVNLTGAVSTVDVSKTLAARPQSDVSKALQGVVPGLTIINNSGRLNAKPTITIRGTGTLSNDAKSNPLIIVDGVAMEDISYLNPNDIENVSVLKDAASTSIYGTRAAFGVILITTKSARKVDRITVNYTNNFSWDTPTMLPDFPDVATQARALRAANIRGNVANELFGMYMDDDFIAKAEAWKQRHGGKSGYREMIPGDDFDLDPATGKGLYYADWDVVGIMFRDWKPAQNHNVSVQGTSGKTSYFLSLGYDREEGVLTFNPDKLKKYNATLNVTSDITDWLQVGGRFSYNDKTYTKPNSRRATYQYMWRWGSFFGPYGTYNGYDMRNDIAYLKQAGEDKTIDSYTRIGGFLKAKLVKGLTLNADYTYNVRNVDQKQIGLPVDALNSWGADVRAPSALSAQSASYLYQESIRDNSYAFNVYANYEASLLNKHNFNVMVGANAEEGEYQMHWSRRTSLLDNNLPEFSLATGDQTVGGSHSEWGTAGWFGRINYDYNGIWLLELNGRYDGSSKFPSSDRWAFFPSGSFGYRFSEEAYFAPLKTVVGHGKLRASYGEIGNQAIGNNMFISTIAKKTAATTYWLDSTGNKISAYDLPSLVSSTLKWERIQTLDFGLDLGLLNNEFNVSFDWYQRTTKDMLAPSKTMPQVLGADAPKVNAGTLRTRGWELNIDWQHRFNEVQVYANVGIGDFQTVITQWENDSELLNSNYSGKVYGDIWGFETDRLFTADDFNADGSYKTGIASQTGLQQGGFVFGPGDIKFKNLDGNNVIDGGKGTADDHGDLKVIGNTTPRYQYSFRLGGSWKGFDLDMFFQGIGKRDVWSTGAFVIPMSRGADAIYASQVDYWSEENPDPDAYYPRMWAGNSTKGTISVLENGNHNFYPQSRYLVNMAYLRFKNLTLGYTLPKSLTQKAYMEKVRVYFSANNICELINKSNAPVDPEVNTTEDGELTNGTWGRIDPMYRTVSFGLQVTF